MFFETVSSNSNDVSQTPPDLLRKPGEPAELQCSHNIQDYNYILWYKQSSNRELQLMGRLAVTSSQPEPKFNTTITLSGNGNKNCILTIKAPTSDDSAVYFCAAYTQ